MSERREPGIPASSERGPSGPAPQAPRAGNVIDERRLRWAMVFVGVGVALLVSPLIAARATDNAQLTADEPQYVLSAISLGEDRDLDITDELAERRQDEFHEYAELPVQHIVQDDGQRVVPHDPLLPAFLAVPVLVGGWVGAKVALAVLAGVLAAAMLWVAVRRFAVPLGIAAVCVVVFALASPLAFYGTQVYPELAAALAVTIAIGAVTGPLGRGGLVALTAAVVALPWLSVKYAPVAVAVVAVATGLLVRRGARRDAGLLVGVLAAAGVVYLVAHHAWYEGWTVYASGDHFTEGELSVMGFDPDYAGRSVRLTGLLTDRQFGLAAWAPAFLLAVPALVALLRRRPPGWAVLALPFAAGWLNATFVALTMHGWWWPGRQVVVVLPCLVLAVAWWVARYRAAFTALVVTGALGVFTFLWFTVEAVFWDRRIIINFWQTGNPWYRVWSLVLPDGRFQPAGTDLLRAAWFVVLAALAVWGWRSVRPRRAAPDLELIEQRKEQECEPVLV